jgi:hypothetical protein
MTDNSRLTGVAIEAHYRFVVWLVPTIEKFPKKASENFDVSSYGWTRRHGIAVLRRSSRRGHCCERSGLHHQHAVLPMTAIAEIMCDCPSSLQEPLDVFVADEA